MTRILVNTGLPISQGEKAAVDWPHRDSALARIRVFVKRILRHYGCPPNLQNYTVQMLLPQAEVLSFEDRFLEIDHN
ncbi:MAG: type I restriction enzyme endonuclease domain-containing protein [Methylococcus sp.]